MGIQDYTIEEREILNEYLEPYLKPYLSDEDKKLKKMTNEILVKLKYHDVNKDDFVSLAHEIIVKAMYDYDFIQDFDGYIYSCLEKKFKTEMTRRTRDKRCTKVKVEVIDNDNNVLIETKIIKDDSLDRMISSPHNQINNQAETTLGDMIPDKNTVESYYFEEREDTYSEEMNLYLSRLSSLQKEVLRLISVGFTPNEILNELHINKKMYEECYKAIHSYRNIQVLF